MPLVAKIRFSSPLPQLDKEFDYLVPHEFADTIDFGFLVEVPFGSGARPKTGIVCGLGEDENPRDKLLSVTKVVSTKSVLSREQLQICLAVAARQAGTVGELLSTAVPKRYVKVESNFPASDSARTPELSESSLLLEQLADHERLYFQPELIVGDSGLADWTLNFAIACHRELNKGRSTLIVLPDFAEMAKFERALAEFGLSQHANRHSSLDSGSARYESHLKALHEVSINYGLRSASFSAAKNLGLILLWDDGDESHTEQSSPYWSSREVLLQRAALEKSKLVLASHSPSAEVIRLIDIKHLEPVLATQHPPKVIVTELSDRLDSQTFALISNTLREGHPVLIQIANAGWASALVCVSCKELRVCPSCSTPIWIDPSGVSRCRSCKLQVEHAPCSCGKTSSRPTKLGASAFSKQMERSFPDVNVLHSNGENRLVSLNRGPVLVVATPGAEPEVDGGFGCVVIADAQSMLGSPRLRALEQSLAKWANAISLASRNAAIVFVGLVGELSKQMMQLHFHEAVNEDYKDRLDLGLPPITRIASIVSGNEVDHQRLIQQLREELPADKVKELGVTQLNTVVLDFPYSYGMELASQLREITQKLSATSKSKKPGERVYRINMDDGKVI